jgi:hypothetical protein
VRRRLLLFALLLVAVSVNAQTGVVTYMGGTVAGFNPGDTGALETAGDALRFESKGRKLKIPYDAIDSFEYSQPVAHHLGVLPAIAVGLFKHRQHRDIFRVFFHDEGGSSQVAIFQVPKQMPQTLEAIFRVRTNLCNRNYQCHNAD